MQEDSQSRCSECPECLRRKCQRSSSFGTKPTCSHVRQYIMLLRSSRSASNRSFRESVCDFLSLFLRDSNTHVLLGLRPTTSRRRCTLLPLLASHDIHSILTRPCLCLLGSWWCLEMKSVTRCLFFSWPGTFRCNICDLLVHVNVSDRNVQIQSDSVQKQIQVNTMRS